MKLIFKMSVLLLALLLPALATAHDFEVDGIYYKINGNEATVTYAGWNYYDYSYEYSGNVTIPATVTYNGTVYSVTSIGPYAFSGCSDLTGVVPGEPLERNSQDHIGIGCAGDNSYRRFTFAPCCSRFSFGQR